MKRVMSLPGFSNDFSIDSNKQFSISSLKLLEEDAIFMQAKRLPPGLGGFVPPVKLGYSWCEFGCDAAQVACSAACAGTGPGAIACGIGCAALGSLCREGC